MKEVAGPDVSIKIHTFYNQGLPCEALAYEDPCQYPRRKCWMNSRMV